MASKLKRGPKKASAPKVNAPKITSIRGKILRRVLPVALLPLFLLGGLAVAGIFLLQQRTTDAVTSAEDILTEQVVEDTVTRASERAARDLAEYVDQWVFRINRLNNQASFREAVVEVSNDTQVANFNTLSPDALNAAVNGDVTTPTRVLALTLLDELKTFEEDENLQILLVSEEGYNIGSTDTENSFDTYAQEEWFQRTKTNGVSFRSFTDDGDGSPAFELALWTEPPATTRGGAVLRVRVSMRNVQWILDEIAGDDAVGISLIDTSASVLLADSSTEHRADLMYDQTTLMSEESGVNLELLRAGTVQNDTTVTSARSVAPLMDNANEVQFNWLVQTNQPLDIAASSLSEVRAVSEDVAELRQFFVLGVIALLAIAIVLGFIAVRSVANSITSPVKILSDQAQAAADQGIPSVVEAARTSEELPELPDFDIDTNDELAILAHSMNTMQDAAVDLAAGQAKLRRQNVARTFVSLGRRNQNLLNRQLEFIDELEQQESDADALENLFRLDHLATRMRRNAENLLVLAGEQTPRRWGKPIAVRDVLRAAASEIADYRRVRLGEIDDATVSGGLATDLSHLIAELLENAGSFSPPTTPIEVLGQHTSTHYRLAIVDQGIGMDTQALAQVNDRLKNPVDFADAPSAYLGLFVVGRLAQEMGITVRLASADPTGEGRRRGTIAFIDLPVELLSSDAASPIEINERTSEGVAHRTEELDAAQVAATPAPEPAPVAPVAQPEPAVVAETEKTAAGFPKRSRGATSVPSTPAVMTPSEPAVAPDPAPAPEPAPVASATAPTAPTPAVPSAPAAPATEITAAGFPKRNAAAPVASAPAPAPMPEPVAGAAPKRDAAEVSNSLRSIRAAVARGRASSTPEAPAAAVPPVATNPAPDSLNPPPVPIAPVAPLAPTPEVTSNAAERPNPPITNQPTQTGSES